MNKHPISFDRNFRKIRLEAELKRIIKILSAKYSPKEIVLFGSVAKGEICETIDIDLMIIKETDKRFIDRIGEVIKLCKPKMAVDFIVYTPEEFHNLKEREAFVTKEIVESGKVVYER